MKVTSSYGVEIIHAKHIFKATIEVYRKALSYLIEIYNSEWDVLSSIDKAKERFNFAERMIHTTKSNIAKYSDFDSRFYKMPSYFRRAAIQSALGSVSSYQSNLQNWSLGNKKGKVPKLQQDKYDLPVFYNGEMFRPSNDENAGYVKLFIDNDWKFIKLHFRKTDVNYLKRYWSHTKASAPKLERKHGKYFLRFTFEEQIELSKTPILKQRICSVDLGLNSDAVCSIMCADGTILARKFINFSSDKDQLYTVLNRIKKFQQKYGSKNVQNRWAYAQRLNDELSKKIANSIIEFAELYSVDCIVFEHLDFKGSRKVGKSKAQKIQMWRKNGIQDYVTHKAHRSGIRMSHICAWGTSKLAFDGSGPVVRDKNNHALCTFANGKRYNCDLSASYNIGARYFIREILKSSSEKTRSRFMTKVPELGRRTSCTLNTLKCLTV